MKFAALLVAFATPATAQDFALRDSDTVPTSAALSDMILDRDVEYFDGGVSRYATDGSYAWTYAAENGGGVWEGTHEFAENATLCVVFVTGIERCDMFVTSGDRLVMLTSDGMRFPVREIR
ncbi:hypothetical protein [Octadecabacter ascidiaceicola]|uniref:Uncharacterized protein n=1 Tax=Octadecabacter ascidiaceicola TaxID=1655543 RepID=A0A238KAF4_9RHOB|nr:hypothetical protein [Octadecabacter ascidiaceicola]SMX39860.1 hypothetical protein OCA8868_02168 [Octadecabacter ascidiaceicola]